MRTIAYLGPEKTNTHLAALRRFGPRHRYVHAPTVEEVFSLVEREEADHGVVPVENSLEGAVTHTLDRFIDFKRSPVKIQGELEQHIRHCFILRPETPRERVRIVYSHPQALAQCRRWLEKHYPRIIRREMRSTAEAVEALLEKGELWKPEERAAIGRAELAEERRLRAIPIPSDRENKTRFLVIGLEDPPRSRRSKTSILFALKDRPGALYDALQPFKQQRINLTKIESRPSKRKAWEYYFFIDFEGHQTDLRVRRALEALKASTTLFTVLGSYPTRKP